MQKFYGVGLAILLMSASLTNAVAADKPITMAEPGTAVTITSATKEFSPGLQGDIEKIVAQHHGVMGVYYHNLETGEKVAVNADEPFETASTIKTPVMCAAFDVLEKGNGPFTGYYDTRPYDAETSVGGSGFLQNYIDGTKMELKELLHLMITVSDNGATNMICEWMGIEPVNAWLDAHGFKQTRMFSTIGGSVVVDPKGRKEWGLGRTTPREMATLMELIATGKAGNAASTDEMLRLLSHQYFDSAIAAGVPPMQFKATKSGSVSSSRSDAGIVNGPGGLYVLAVYTKHNKDRSWTRNNEGENNIRKVSNLVWNHCNPDEKYDRPEGAEKF